MFEKEAEKWADKMYPCDGQAQRYLLMGGVTMDILKEFI